jgi:hypothetical protein
MYLRSHTKTHMQIYRLSHTQYTNYSSDDGGLELDEVKTKMSALREEK